MKSIQYKVIYTILSILIITFVSYKLINHNKQETELIVDPLASLDFNPKKGNEYMEAKMIRYELDKPLLIIKEKKGMLACAYINVETCNKTNEACAIVSGVSSYKDMMSAKIIAVSNEALNLGVNVGDTGISAINRFK
ncbi:MULTISPECIES: DUF1805 domain-containing protein [Moritella]|uniref:Uncharacterized protein n=2 Tax=Moritella viscosa TaxID=80854 RepID=A0A090II09_9GAMM|nr:MULTISPECIES: DUF1805 domain-containing protein [Moritella]CED59674.1 membrane protein [Moritella viscosa]SGY89393.1 Putative uncharacterized protein [Moritella viscosa]SGY91625.1 Putative uncharacterized protein [Moritella viscosa]SGY92025.1 Putative uncharacterized protein [Moritella viscosa]SGZ02862.1 Putative uncharacterized protein [Moritella viscosa]